MSEYETELEKWKDKNGLGQVVDNNPDEIRMAAEEAKAKGKSWCLGCEKHMMIREMKLITRSVDAYVQFGEWEGDYIPQANRVRMCSDCYNEAYQNE